MPTELGFAVLIGVFVLAGVLIVAKARAARASEERLRGLGFEPCEGEAKRLLDAFAELAGGHVPGATRRFDVARCYKKPVGSGWVYRFAVADLSARAEDDRAPAAPVSDAYLFDLGKSARAVLRPCSLFLSGLGGGFFQAMLAKVLAAQPLGQKLELSPERSGAVLAAFGSQPGRLDEHLSLEVQERVASAPRAGFFAAHFGLGKAAFLTPQGMRDVDAQWNYILDWV